MYVLNITNIFFAIHSGRYNNYSGCQIINKKSH